MKTKTNTLLILTFKSAKIVKAVKALKALKPLKALISAGTMFLSVIAYSFTLGWKFAAGLVGMLFIHEIGHVIACKRKGIPASAPIFIPFLGSAIFIPKMSKPEDEAYVGIGGPYLGSLGALLCFFLFLLLPEKYPALLVLSYMGAFLNLFNLIPVRPLDGGRITQVIGAWFKWVGVGMLLLLTIATKDPGLLVIWIIVLDELEWNKKFKFYFGLGIGVLMVSSMLVLRVNSFLLMNDFFIASIILLFMALKAFGNSSEHFVEEEKSVTPETIPMVTRVKWFCYYCAITVALIFFIKLNQTLLSGYVFPR